MIMNRRMGRERRRLVSLFWKVIMKQRKVDMFVVVADAEWLLKMIGLLVRQ